MADIPTWTSEDLLAAYGQVRAERDRLREALERIERQAGAAGSGETPGLPLAEIAREALAFHSRPEGDGDA